MELSFGEQIKIILKRKNMTIQDLANLWEVQTGCKMTRQNLSQRLRRDNFPEQDMRILAGLLGYQVSVQLTQIAEESILSAPFQSFAAAPPPKPVLHTLPTKQISSSEVTTADGSTLQIPKLFHKEEAPGEINPLTGEEYLTNTVRQHPDIPKYLQVYDRATHEWIDVNEDYFWEFQASKKQILGTDYQEPILI